MLRRFYFRQNNVKHLSAVQTRVDVVFCLDSIGNSPGITDSIRAIPRSTSPTQAVTERYLPEQRKAQILTLRHQYVQISD